MLINTTIAISQNNTLLWEVSGNGLKNKSYLYGTYHSQDYRAHQFGDSVLPKLLKADAVITENIDIDKNASKKMFAYAIMKDKKLENLLNKDDYNFVKEKVFEIMGTSGALYNSMKPIFTMIMAGQLTARKEMDFTVDEFIKNIAKNNNKKLIGLETGDEAMAAINAITLEEQGKMLVDFFKEYDKSVRIADSIIKIYQRQDLNTLYKVYTSNDNTPETFDKNLVEKRNIKFTEKLIPLIKEQSVFCAVGALHLPGETGLINALRNKGYTVTPIYSKHSPKTLHIDDKREWFNYGNDTLMISVNFPNDPFLEIKESEATVDKIKTVIYTLNDSIYNLKYAITILNITDTAVISNPINLYDNIVANLGLTKGWIKIKDENIIHDERKAKEVEFNIAKGVNNRTKIIANGKLLYVLNVTGKKEVIYSNVAEHFFNENVILNPILYLNFNITDEITQAPLGSFETHIKSSVIDTIIKPDSIGYMAFSLPRIEDEYMITFNSNGYVSKKILVSTFGINQTSKPELLLIGDVSMIKTTKGNNYDIYNSPVAKAKIVNKSAITWDIKYINEFKEKIKSR